MRVFNLKLLFLHSLFLTISLAISKLLIVVTDINASSFYPGKITETEKNNLINGFTIDYIIFLSMIIFIIYIITKKDEEVKPRLKASAIVSCIMIVLYQVILRLLVSDV
ncbi:hypothetical protein [Mangrovibacillus cuniculi]|uniref:DUF5658 domain-containing protein n=1 Tax=Mangrovibacillus cuniculi TaxID=2593652 RepID=A0A7S8CCS4_9BACI|nr:hypothetical protein [Mangrovibacillus cuniculi]QPC47605.1 hypothetical protein G8O30_11900 [Mangrovibacillus cuniculi]